MPASLALLEGADLQISPSLLFPNIQTMKLSFHNDSNTAMFWDINAPPNTKDTPMSLLNALTMHMTFNLVDDWSGNLGSPSN
ncbi:hypothetical protein VNO77_03479 [Canavalia gladiata]|uniref:Uncharacterized protein n=1 Tax=Canavalia gladiata TaxID=3824 RepID=A0AAN9N0G0_CANGL